LYDLSVGGKLFVRYGVESFADTLRERELVGENSPSGSGNNRPCFLGVEERNAVGWLHLPNQQICSFNYFLIFLIFCKQPIYKKKPAETAGFFRFVPTVAAGAPKNVRN
jgi:hypothetical protein